MKLWDRVEVEWVDSDRDSGWQLTADLHNQLARSMLCKSVGYYFRDIGDSIQLVQSQTGHASHNEQVNGILTIPKVAIKRKRILS